MNSLNKSSGIGRAAFPENETSVERVRQPAHGEKEPLLPKIAFCVSLVCAGFAYGYLSHVYGLPPQSLISAARQGWLALREKTGGERPWYFVPSDRTEKVIVHQPEAVAPGLTLFTGIGKDSQLFARLVDRDGDVVNEWSLDWFDVWPDPTHLDEENVPKSAPGTFIHGIVPMEDGGIVFNYEALGMVRMDAAGRVLWRLPYRSHHALMRDDDGNFWAPGRKTHKQPWAEFPLYKPPFEEYTIVKVSPDGELLEEKSVFELLRDNNLMGLLYQAARDGMEPDMTGDTLHMNDVKVFSARMTPGVLEAGDVMISLRNINAVLIFRQSEWTIKYLSVGKVIRQHDPDFIDGNTISIFDNNHLGDREDGLQSRILIEDLRTGETRIAFQGTEESQFFTDIMGKHQQFPGGNLLLLEARAGRIWEVDASGRLVWELNNIIEPGMMAAVTDMLRLPEGMTAERARALRAAALASPSSTGVAHSP